MDLTVPTAVSADASLVINITELLPHFFQKCLFGSLVPKY